jgi:hypothetical protein
MTPEQLDGAAVIKARTAGTAKKSVRRLIEVGSHAMKDMNNTRSDV